MAKKPDITTIATGYYSRQALNSNFENLQTGFDNTLSLDGSTPNAMGADLDMNGNVITNASAIYVGGDDIVTTTATALAAAVEAQADAEAAVVSATASAATATTGASTATTKASEASASASAAATSETNAATSESNAATSETNAATSASSASTSATTATAAASTATTKASEASTSATNASNSATLSVNSASAAQTAQTAAEAALDSFDDIYLGPKASEPTLDNDGDALVAGSLYYNTTLDKLYVYSGSVWQVTAGAAAGDLQSVNNLSDLTNFVTARDNLGLAIGTDVQAYSTILANTTASFTTADETKLDGIEALADVTDTANVTAAGALMDSELTNITAVKALNQGVATTDSPTFAGITLDGNSFTNNVIAGTGPTLVFSDTGTNDDWRIRNANGAFIFENGVDGSPTTDRMKIDLDGDISFYDDAGGAKFFWDSSSSSLGLGTTSPTLATLDIVGTGDTKPAIHVTSGETYVNTAGNTVPRVPTDGLINIENGQLKIWPDMSGDGDYDADIWARGNLYLAADARIHLRTKIDEFVGAGTDEGRLVIGSTEDTNYIQSAKNYSGTVLKDLAIGEYNSTNWWMYFDQSAGGWVGINTTTPASALDVNGTITSTGLDVNGNTYFGNPPDGLPSNNASGEGAVMNSTGKLSMLGDSDWSLGIGRHTTVGQVAYFYYSGSVVGNIAVTASATSYNTSSDYRLKEDWQPMVGASDRVMALNPVNFAWKSDGSRVDGFLAHEVQAVVPEVVTGEKDAVDADGVPEMQAIDQSKLVPLLTAALQEALTKIDALEVRIAALEAV